ncbi:MAG: hypothetical protein JJU12_06505 [Chlamydiales bacterium]|nr:hypothetical protein [Chlamydiales bacterium]
MSFIKENLGGLVDTILNAPDNWADKVKDPKKREITRKALYILYDLGLILLAAGLGSMMMGFSLHGGVSLEKVVANLNDMGLQTVMGGGMALCGAGAGLGFLIQDILPKKAHRTAAKVAALAMPLLLAGAVAALIIGPGITGGSGLQFSLSQSMTSLQSYIGLLLIPVALYAAIKAPQAFKSRTPYISGNIPLITKGKRRRNRPLSSSVENLDYKEKQERIERLESQRTHEGGFWSNLSNLCRRPPRPQEIELEEL